jgi:hypothetical protein
VPQRDVQLAGHRGERPAQLVRGVGGEAPVGGDGAVQAVEHRVEQHRHPSDFVGDRRRVEAGVEVALGDPRRLLGDALHRGQGARRQAVADRGGDPDAGDPDRGQQPGQRGEAAVDVVGVEADADGERPPVAR